MDVGVFLWNDRIAPSPKLPYVTVFFLKVDNKCRPFIFDDP